MSSLAWPAYEMLRPSGVLSRQLASCNVSTFWCSCNQCSWCENVSRSCSNFWSVSVAARSTAARLLRSWFRIPPGARMSVCCEYCVLSGRGLCDELITRPEESYRLWRGLCDLEKKEKIPPGGMNWFFIVIIVCGQVEVSATSWSLVQRSPTDCDASSCVI